MDVNNHVICKRVQGGEKCTFGKKNNILQFVNSRQDERVNIYVNIYAPNITNLLKKITPILIL